ncbi:DNA methyltransferase [Tautonia plasticadhaerens]|uniref:DNA methyltransferase n=1 Tax=Tautonia plasticadhaerens TaxID=2527974 RepID=UPI0018D24D69|nr:DNA methyltransferase [Tautonia plasticadhaerens]
MPEINADLREQLRRDIDERGILVPILVTQDGEVLDGKLRLAIAQELGIKNIPKIIVGKLSPGERQDLRLAVNLYRRHLTREQVRHLVEWALRQQPEASDRSIATRCGVSPTTVGTVRRGVQVGHLPTRNGQDGKRYPSTRKPVVITSSESQAREAAQLLSELGDDAPDRAINIKKLRRVRSAKGRADLLARVSEMKPGVDPDYVVHHCDFRSLTGLFEPGSVDLVLADPPWGGQFSPHRRAFAETIERLLKPDGIAAIYTGVAHMPEFLDELRAVGLKYLWTIVAARKASTVNQRHRLINRLVPIVLVGKGGLRTSTVLNDLLDPMGREKQHHPWQQPIEEAVEIIRALCPPGGLVADVCTGSGSTAVATIRVGEGRRFAGCEVGRGTVEIARARIVEALEGRDVGADLETAMN